MVGVAPYASIPIQISVMSTTGLKYRTYSCFECGAPFMDREGDYLYRVGVKDLPEETHVTGNAVSTHCGRCQQMYELTVARVVQTAKGSVPLYMQPQSIYLNIEPVKHFRNTHCLECGKAYYSISDRIRLVVDNIVPIGMDDLTKLGAMEARCNFKGCKARWHIRT